MAPEVVNSRPHGLVADFWAFGVIIYELMNGKRPYSGVHRKEYKENLASNEVQIKVGEQPDGWSDNCVDIVNKLLKRKEDKRLGAMGIDQIKKHKWFKDFDWSEVLNMKMNAPFLPIRLEDYFDDSYLESFVISTKLKEDIILQKQNLVNPDVQKLFRNFYYDKDKEEIEKNKLTTASSGTKSMQINSSRKEIYQ